ncbi:MAG: TonB-dependent receptor, partial [Bacteroidota bacterium]
MPRPGSCSTLSVLFSNLFCIWCLFAGNLAFGQELAGTIRDQAGNPLPGVHVIVSAIDRGTVSDVDGKYNLSGLDAGRYEVQFSFVGFLTRTEMVQIGDARVVYNVTLEPEVLAGEEILISESRTDALTINTRSVSVLAPEKLVDLRGQTLGETLETLPGVTLLQTGPSIAKPVVRGLHSQRVLVLNAGVSQEGQQWGGEHAPEIDPFAPVEIQVIKGVSGVEYGVGAIGGVIRLDPLELPYVPGHGVSGNFSLNGFSNNLQAAGAVYLEGAAPALPGLGWRIQTSYRKAGDAHAPDYVIRNSAFQEFNGSASVGFRRERVNLVALYSRFSTELGIFSGAHIGNLNDLLRAIERGGPSFIGEFGYDIVSPKQEITHNLLSLHADYRMPAGSWFEFQYGFQRNHRQEFDAHGRGDDNDLEIPAFDLSLVSHSAEVKFHHKPIGQLIGVVGISGMNQLNKNGATGFLIPNFRAYSGGIFARESWVTEELTIEAGARLDYRWVRAWPRENGSRGDFVKRISDYASVSGVVGSIWQFAPSWSFGANLGTGWRPPSVNELYNFGVHHGTAQFLIGDPDLSTERSVGIDATLRHDSEHSRFEFSAYYNNFDGFIFLFPDLQPRVTIRGTFPTFRYSQADAVLRGFETSFEQDVASWLTLGTQLSVVRADNRETNEPLINMPSDRASFSAEFRLPDRKRMRATHFSLESNLVRKQTRVPANVDYMPPPDGYALFNAGFSSTLLFSDAPVRVNLSVQNVLNTGYRDYLSRFRYFIDDPGRSLVFRMQV